MANTIRIKRSTGSSAPASLANAELAFAEGTATLYYGTGTGGAGGTATSIIAIGGTGAFVGLGGTQTITGDKTFSGNVTLGSAATATTPSNGDSSTKVATTAFVQDAISSFGVGTVTSVALSLPTSIFDVSGSPVTTNGTLSATLDTQAANYVWAGPATGSADTPAFRALVAGDIPDLSGTYLPLSGGSLAGGLVIGGDLTVNGTTTTINSTTVSTDDKNIELGATALPSDATANGGGVILKGTTDKTILWSSTSSAWETNVDFRVTKNAGDVELTIKALDTVGSDADARLIVDAGNTGEAEISFRYLGVEKSYFSSRNDTNTLIIGGTNVDLWTAGSSSLLIDEDGNANLFGSLTLGSELSVANGGTGVATLTGLVKGNGTSAFSAAVAGTDYLSPSSEIDGGSYLWIFGLTGLVLSALMSAGSVAC